MSRKSSVSKNQDPVDDFSQYCISGTNINFGYVQVSENVSLKVIEFIPPQIANPITVVFVAGWISQISSWEKVLLEMSKDFRIIYIETREKLSSKIHGKVGYGVEDMGLDLIAIIDYYHLEENKYILFGSSLGGTAILDCCKYLEKAPLALVLIAPNALFRVPRFGRIIIWIFPPPLYLIFKPFIKWYLKTFRLDTKSDSAQYIKYSSALDAADPWKLKKAAKALKDYTVWNELSNIDFPVLVIGASTDLLHEPDKVVKIAKMLPKGQHKDLQTNTRMHQAEAVQCIRDFISNDL